RPSVQFRLLVPSNVFCTKPVLAKFDVGPMLSSVRASGLKLRTRMPGRALLPNRLMPPVEGPKGCEVYDCTFMRRKPTFCSHDSFGVRITLLSSAITWLPD